MKRLAVALALAMIGCSVAQGPATANAAEIELSCPLSFDGLVPGSSRERNVIALYGEGVHDPDGGDTGSRSYAADMGREVRFVFGVDHVLDRIIIEKTAGRGTAPSDPILLLSETRFWRRLLPGHSEGELRRLLGEPQSSDGEALIYRPDRGACSAGGFVSFEIRHGVVQRVIIAGDDHG